MPIAPRSAASKSPVAGRAAPALLALCGGAALVAAGFAARMFLGEGPLAESSAEGSRVGRSVIELEQRVADLTARLEEMERRNASLAVRTAETAAHKDGPAAAGGETPADVAAAGVADGGRNNRRDLGFEELRKLRDAPDDAARLAAARELANSDNPMVAMSGLRVLADLAPKEALAIVDKMFAQSQKGDVSAWQVDRAIATLADSKGAGQISTELTEALRRYFRDGTDDVKSSVARALEKQGDSGPMTQLVASLSADLGNADVGRRTKSIEALAQTRSHAAAPLLLPLLTDGSDEVRLRTLDALRRTGDATTIEKILPLLNDPVAAVRDRATRTIEGLRRGEGEFDPRGGFGGFGGFPFGGNNNGGPGGRRGGGGN